MINQLDIYEDQIYSVAAKLCGSQKNGPGLPLEFDINKRLTATHLHPGFSEAIGNKVSCTRMQCTGYTQVKYQPW